MEEFDTFLPSQNLHIRYQKKKAPFENLNVNSGDGLFTLDLQAESTECH